MNLTLILASLVGSLAATKAAPSTKPDLVPHQHNGQRPVGDVRFGHDASPSCPKSLWQ